jgi:hypothetical protein
MNQEKSADAYIVLVRVKAAMEREYFYYKDHDKWKEMLVAEKMMKIVEEAMDHTSPNSHGTSSSFVHAEDHL